MEQRSNRLQPNRQIQEEAAGWFIQFNADTPDVEVRAQFDEWLRASPEHIRAYMELLPLWHDSASLRQVNELSREKLLALATQPGINVTALPQASAISYKTHKRMARYRRPLAVAAAVLVVLTIVFVYQTGFSGVRNYSTDIAEVRTITLEDGTQLSIGAQSTVTIRYTDTARMFHLEGGDIYVNVAKDVARPFVVEVKDRIIRALGTQFEVRADERRMRVAVLEGAVSVSDAGVGGEPDSVFLKAGEQLTARRHDRLEAPKPIRSKELAAWRTGRLVFDDANLGDVIREFNRYNVKQLRLLDPSLQAMPIAAAFSSADPGSLVRFLQDQPGVAVTENHGEILIDAR